MKTKTLIISLCLIFGIALSQAEAQSSKSRVDQGWTTGTYWSPVFCGDELVDFLRGGSIRVHYVVHYTKDGAYNFEIDQIKGEVTSITGETFRIRETDRIYFTDYWYVTWKYNLIGDMGTHYIGTLTLNYGTRELTVVNTVCK
ncbi:MAG: hypothetical protein LC649_01710 [Bacteroidales bacterium]|nr:hypothetical protein [Bacteroidales bacterium]